MAALTGDQKIAVRSANISASRTIRSHGGTRKPTSTNLIDASRDVSRKGKPPSSVRYIMPTSWPSTASIDGSRLTDGGASSRKRYSTRRLANLVELLGGPSPVYS